ncbi:MAG: sulfatase-like hydrolase/transferase [Planctomycetes bacterium]|nr:sulfatase-like hydrolase/transferase [Planctomycetota bacterium]
MDDGQGAQRVEARLNGAAEPLAAFDLEHSDRADRRTFVIPEELLRQGENRLSFSFARLLPWRYEAEGFRYAAGAIFRSIEFQAGAQDAPPAAAPGPDLALRLPYGRPRLTARLAVHPDDRAERAVPLIVRLQAEPAGQLLLAREDIDAAAPPAERRALDLDADLSLFAGAVVSIQFETAAPQGGARPLRLALAEPAIRGGDAPRDAAAPPEAPLLELRRRLQGASLVLITVDAAAARHFTAYGAQVEHAPNIDTLARDGIVFEDVSSPASYTLAAVGSLMTGLYPDRHGVVAGAAAGKAPRLAEDAPALAALLRARGYATVALVTNPNAAAEYGFARGFDFFDPLYDRSLGMWDEGVAAALLAPRLAVHIEEDKLAEPYFLYVHVFQPHAPYRPPEAFRAGITSGYDRPADGSRQSIDAYKTHQVEPYGERDFQALRELYDANLSSADAAAGEILALLRARGLLERALVAVVSDHGEALGEHLSLEHGDTVFGEQVEVPWVMSLPPQAGLAPVRVAGPSSLIDVAPTLLSLLGAGAEDLPFEGRDLSPGLFGARGSERPLFLRSSGARPRFGIRFLGRSYHEDLFTRQQLLFDLSADPLEEKPLDERRAVFAEFLRAELCRFLCTRGARAAEEAALPEELLEELREIGYVHAAAEEEPTRCPLARRSLKRP